VRLDTDEIIGLAMTGQPEQPDELTYIFKIRDDIFFHDTPDIRKRYPSLAGRQLTAEDVKFSIERYSNLSTAPARDYHLHYLDKVEVMDDFTVRVTNKRPFSWTLSSTSLGSWQAGTIIPREVIEKEGDLKTTAIGSGPYILAGFSQKDGVTLDRNPNYFVPELPYLDGQRWHIINSPEAGEAAFRAGDIDSYGPPNKVIAESLGGLSGVIVEKVLSYLYVTFGVRGDVAPWNDERVRKALNLAFDRDDMILRLEGGRKGDDPTELGLWSGPVTWALEAYSLSQEELRRLYSYDPAEAKRLLSAAGYPEIEVKQRYANIGQWAQLAEVVAGQLREIGIQVKLEPQDIAVYIGKTLFQRDFEMTSFYNLISFHSPEFPLRYFTSPGISGEGNWFYYSDPDVDDMYDRIAVTFDKEERREMVLDMQRLIISKNPCVMSLYCHWGFSAFRDYVKGRTPPGWGPAGRYRHRVWFDK